MVIRNLSLDTQFLILLASYILSMFFMYCLGKYNGWIEAKELYDPAFDEMFIFFDDQIENLEKKAELLKEKIELDKKAKKTLRPAKKSVKKE